MAFYNIGKFIIRVVWSKDGFWTETTVRGDVYTNYFTIQKITRGDLNALGICVGKLFITIGKRK